MSKKSIREVVESYGVKLWPIGEGILRGFCPLHNNVNTASFTIYTNTESFFCFGESVGGDAAYFVSRMENIPYVEAKKIVDGDANLVEDVAQMLDSAAIVDDADYGEQLNFTVSKHCHGLLVDGLVPIDKIFDFLRVFDKEVLTKRVTHDIVKSVLASVQQLRGTK